MSRVAKRAELRATLEDIFGDIPPRIASLRMADTEHGLKIRVDDGRYPYERRIDFDLYTPKQVCKQVLEGLEEHILSVILVRWRIPNCEAVHKRLGKDLCGLRCRMVAWATVLESCATPGCDPHKVGAEVVAEIVAIGRNLDALRVNRLTRALVANGEAIW